MSRVFSAPGKALIAGGYLVLDPQYYAYVTALSSRMHARIEPQPLVEDRSIITVNSPQFNGAWRFDVTCRDGHFETSTTGGDNLFLEETIKVVLAYVMPEKQFNYCITLFSDPGFHSQEGAERKVSRNSQRVFLYHHKPISDVPKTGMGLSAGLVSVVATALLACFLEKPVNEILETIHNVSQIAHCGAQGKVGSGFDVAAAVYGSIIYKRFQPSIFQDLLGEPVSQGYSHKIQNVVNSKWNFVHDHCTLPPGLHLLMGDVNGGSETPKLVSKVTEWRKSDPKSDEVYQALNNANTRFMAEMKRLNLFAQQNRMEYDRELEAGTLFMRLANCLSAIRAGLQLLTNRSGAKVEPSEQTYLLDKCEELPGCLGGVVPGAGGYDAVCLLVDVSQVKKLQDATRSDITFDTLTWLDLCEQAQGIVEENHEEFEGL